MSNDGPECVHHVCLFDPRGCPECDTAMAALKEPKPQAPKSDPLALELAKKIAELIAAQNEEFDELGDSESICFMGELPTINLVELAEGIQTYMLERSKTLVQEIDAARQAVNDATKNSGDKRVLDGSLHQNCRGRENRHR